MWKFVLNKMFKMREKFAVDLGKGDAEKPFIEHLDDLRTMLVRMVTTLLIVTIGMFFFYKELVHIIKLPLIWSGVFKTVEEATKALISTDPTGPFMTVMNVTLISGVIVAFPVLVIFILQFILPGLKDNEKKLIFPALSIATLLFLSGISFAYFLVLPRALEFFWTFGADMGVVPMWTLNEYITFSTRFILIFGIAFELPILVMVLVKLDILNYKLMKTTRPHAVVAIAVFSAVITPTQDALTLLLMIAPLYVLYEICIWLARYLEKKDREMYPEYYKEIERDEAELAKEEASEWDNEDYNPWSSSENDDDEEELVKRKPAAEEAKPQANSAEAATSTDSSTGTSEPAATPEPEQEKTLEESSREDEKRNTD